MFSLQNTALRSKFDRKTGTTYCRNMISLKNISLTTPSPVIVSLLSSWATKGTVALPNQMTFRKSSNPKIYIADFGNFKQAFLSMRLIQKSNFRVQGVFFFNKERIPLPNRMNFWKNSKRPLTPPSFSKLYCKFFIMDMVAYLQGGMRAR